MSWSITEVSGEASVHHSRLPTPHQRQVRVVRVTAPALVLGSTQPDDLADREAVAGLGGAVVRRRSGGGAVWLVPDDPLWVDVAVPAGDALHHDDVGRAFHWLGEAWATALSELGLEVEVHRGPADSSVAARLVCFAGRGPGEVFVAGQKVVGMCQRRTREGSVFQCAVHRSFDPAPLLRALGRPRDAELAAALPSRGTGVPHEDVLEAFLAALPTP